jgi:hypothetical protein
MRHALTVLTLLALAVPAFAADGQPAKGTPGTNVEMPYLMAPMTGADGKLAGYAYISTLLTATSEPNTLAVRDKLAFIQDAFVRDVNGSSVEKAGDPGNVDQPALQARLLADAKRVMGEGRVASITIVTIQVASLHPTQTPAQTTPPPADSTAKAAGSSKPGG